VSTKVKRDTDKSPEATSKPAKARAGELRDEQLEKVSGGVTMQDLHFTKTTNTSSPNLGLSTGKSSG
jgi:type VI protein secretion system component Hcp